MDTSKLEDEIEIIFEKERLIHREDIPLYKELDTAIFLSKLYDRYKDKTNLFCDILKKKSSDENFLFYSANYLAFDLLLRKKQIKKAFELLEIPINLISTDGRHWIRCFIRAIYVTKTFNFTENELKEILICFNHIYYNLKRKVEINEKENALLYAGYKDKSINKLIDLHNQFKEIINSKRMNLLEETLSKEIDEETFEENFKLIDELNLGEDIKGELTKLRENYYLYNNKIDIAKEIAGIRPLFNTIIKRIVKEIYNKNGAPFSDNLKEDEYKNYLYTCPFIGEHAERRLIQGLHGTLSNKGSHKFKSEKEYFRICLNLFLYITFLILTNYEYSINQSKTKDN